MADTETSKLIPDGEEELTKGKQADHHVPESETPKVVYTTKHMTSYGDPFRIADIARVSGIGEYYVATAVSLCVTAAFSVNVVSLSYPIRLFSDTMWGSSVPGKPVPSTPSALQPLWNFISKDCIAVTGVAVFPFVAFLVWYFLACIPPLMLDLMDLKWTRKYKTQPNQTTTIRDMAKALKVQLQNLSIGAAPGLYLMYLKGGPWPYHGPAYCAKNCHGASLFPDAAPSLTEFFFHLVCCLMLFDFTYGFWHYVHHLSRPLYRHIHQFHHTYYVPFAFVTQYVVYCELIVVSVVSVVLPPAMGAHPLTQLVWTLSSIQLSVDAHSGYDFPFMFTNWFLGGPLLLGVGSPAHHDRHHQRPRTNFFPFLSWGDRMLGTAWHGDEVSENDVKKCETSPNISQ